MQLNLFRVGNNLADYHHDGPSWEDEFDIALSPSHPVLELDLTDLLERRSTEVLHVKVTREVKPGLKQVAHFHLSLSVTSNDRVRGELVAATGPHKSVSKWAVANWRDPVNPEEGSDD